jgi:hypothetical protein
VGGLGRIVGWFLAKRYSQVDLDLPTGDSDLLDDEAQQTLTLVEVELIEAGGDACGEVAYTPPELIVAGQFPVTGLELVLLGLQTRPAAGDLAGSALQVGEGDEPGLVEVAEASALLVDLLDLSGEAGELGVEDLVFGDGVTPGEGRLAGEEQFWA